MAEDLNESRSRPGSLSVAHVYGDQIGDRLEGSDKAAAVHTLPAALHALPITTTPQTARIFHFEIAIGLSLRIISGEACATRPKHGTPFSNSLSVLGE